MGKLVNKDFIKDIAFAILAATLVVGGL